MKSIPLRWLIITPFVLLALIAGVLMYFVSTITISNIANHVGEQYIKEVESRIDDRVGDFIAPLSDILEVNRDAFTNKPELLNNLIPIATRFYEQAIPFEYMTFISVATADGRFLASARDPIGKMQHNIAANFIHKPFTMEGFNYHPKHNIGTKIETDPTFNYDPRERPFYLDALKAQTMTWSDIHPYYGQATLGVGLSVPIYDANGAVLGVTATSVALIELDDYLESLELVDNAYIFLAEENGALIATSSKDALYNITEGTYTRLNLNNHPDPLFKIASQHLKKGSYQLNLDGEIYLYRVSNIKLKYGKTWLIGILIPSSYHEGILTEYTQTTIFITLSLFACIAIIGSTIAWYIGKPIQQLNKAANDKKIESILLLPQPMSRIREISSLNQGLHAMAENLLDILQHLEQKVSERTSHLQDENENLLESSLTDELTTLYNRRGFNLVFEKAFNSAQNKAHPLTFVLGDIDYFKRINDEFGHTLGDSALVAVAANLKKHTRAAKDIVARYGGEEFVLVFLDMEAEQVLERLNNIQQEFAAVPVFENQHITMSFGLVDLKESPNASAEALIEIADKRLYQAKNSGRNKIVG
ncbi:sensor domain-containing diguanylate cyclase [Psychromonas arctica]|uniref:sensor domain-containing diguanylate cyclase n=1 Tax=Psychromonas arctica TaxID=168275 RepID=UPI00048B7F90|nr:sensor domain-containing diguanylate cyclase [Psychromonas arctica]